MLCVFDLDGTLIDSERGIVACIMHAFARLNLVAPSQNELRQWIGPPLHASFAPLLAHNSQRIAGAIEYYHERFHTDGWREHDVYPGIEALVRRLAAAGHQLAVVTSKPQRHAAPIMANLSFGDAFARLYGPQPHSQRSEKASMIAAALKDFDAEPEDTVMIGDRRFDIEGAVANKVRGIGVLWGFGARDELEQAGAAAIAATPDELEAILDE